MTARLSFCGLLFAAAVFGAEPQPYDKIVTAEARTSRGAFVIHKVGDEYYFEIPKAELDRDFLWNGRISQTTNGSGLAGSLVASLVVRWQLTGNRVLLRRMNYEVDAQPGLPVASAVRASNAGSIMASFDVTALAPDGAPVIAVNRLFTSEIADFGLRRRFALRGVDPARTFVDRVSPYPGNVEVEATQTWWRDDLGSSRGDVSIVVHHSMVRLPEKPMTPRLYDDRIGFFQTTPYYYGPDDQRVQMRRVINRWRLEKKDPNAAVSEPVRPIIYYMDAATPVKWRDWIRKGVEEWVPALEQAGFHNAIRVRMAPDAAEDPEFSPEDLRYPMIRWLPSTTQNAYGTTVNDPRTGETLNASVDFHQNILNLARNWYFVQAADLDPGASRLPLSDEAMGRAIQMLVAHEMGHTLGLEHNVKASSLYPQEKVRDKDWVHRMGFTPSVMDYVRFNYVAQPEDGIAVEDLPAHVGPYDRWAIHWGYAPVPGADTAEAERPVLDRWAREQETTPWLRYTTLVGWGGGADTGEQAEAVGDEDAIKSTEAGLKNLRRIGGMLVPATNTQTGEPLDDLSELYNFFVTQWTTELNHVAAIVGGATSQAKNAGQPGRVFTPVAGERQRLAVSFLNRNAFATPAFLIDADLLRRIEPSGAVNRIRSAQAGVLGNLLDSGRFARIVEQEAMDGASAWSPTDFLAAVRTGVWGELEPPAVRIDVWRRGLQTAYLDIAIARAGGANGDERSMYRAELKDLDGAIRKALGSAADRETRAHLETARARISVALEPRSAPAEASVPGVRPATAAAIYGNGCFPESEKAF